MANRAILVLIGVILWASAQGFRPLIPQFRRIRTLSSTETSTKRFSASADEMSSSASAVKRKLYSFEEARKVARGHGFSTKKEFIEYDCPGAYQLPKNPDQVWAEEWKGWDDWLGIPWKFVEGKERARKLAASTGVSTREEYMKLFQEKKIVDPDDSRLPFRPDLYYKDEWQDWDDYLGTTKS